MFESDSNSNQIDFSTSLYGSKSKNKPFPIKKHLNYY